MTARRAILLPRLSKSRKVDLTGGAARQLIDHLRPMAERLGADVVAELGLKDRSASRYKRKPRLEYLQAMAMLDAGQADTIIFWDVSRLTREPREMDDLIDRVDANPQIKCYSVNGELDLLSPEGRQFARNQAAAAAYESDQTSKRGKDYQRWRRGESLPPSTGAFGWVDTYTRDGEQARWVEWMVERVLRGESMQNVARHLNAKGVARRRSERPWTVDAVRSVITTPRNYGLVLHHSEKCVCKGAGWLVRDDKPRKGGAVERISGDRVQCQKGEPRPSAVEGFLHVELYHRVLSTLDKRGNRVVRPRRAGMLAGIVHCSECDQPLVRSKTGSGRATLMCRKRENAPLCCGAGSIDCATVERAIVDAVIEWVDGVELAELVSPHARVDTDAINRRLATLAVKEEKANRSWLDDLQSDAAHDDALRQIKAEREELLASLATAAKATVLVEYAGKPGVLSAAWPKLTDPARRQVIVDALDLGARPRPGRVRRALRHQRIVVDPPPPGPHRNSYNSEDPAVVAAELARLRWAEAT